MPFGAQEKAAGVLQVIGSISMASPAGMSLDKKVYTRFPFPVIPNDSLPSVNLIPGVTYPLSVTHLKDPKWKGGFLLSPFDSSGIFDK